MRRIYASILLLGFIILIGCGGDDGTTPAPEDNPIAESTIGVDGGSLETEGFVLDVPASAFAADADLKLYEASTTDAPDETDTGVYKLGGLPASVVEPLSLTLQCSAAPTGDPLIAVGAAVEPNEGESFIVYTYIPADLDGVTLTCEWEPETDAAKSTDGYTYFFGPRIIRSHRISGPTHTLFMIHYPPEGIDHATTFNDNLESAYTTYQNLGFDFSRPHDSGFHCFPTEITFAGETPPANTYVKHWSTRPWSMAPASRLTLYRDHLSTFDIGNLCMATGAALGQIIMKYQVPYSQHETANTVHVDWLCEAFGLWAESLFTANSNHVPARFDARHLDLMLDYLVDDEDNDVALMLRTCDALRTGTPAGEAFFEVTATESSNWWPGFLASFIAGDIYDVHSSVFLDQSNHYFMNEVDWAEAPSPIFNDLSAQLYRLSPSYDEWGDGTYLDLEVLTDDVGPGYAEALVFTLDGTDLTLVARGTDLRINGLKDLHDNGIGLLVAVVNAAWDFETLDDVEITLDMAVGQSNLTGYTRGHISATADAYVAGEGWQTPGFYMDPYTTRDGTWNGNTLTIDMAYENANIRETGAIIVTFDPDTMDVTSYSGSVVHEQFDVDLVVIREIAGDALPLFETDDDWISWRLDGAEACTSLTRFYTRRAYGGVISEEWTDFDCHDGGIGESFMEIWLRNPDL